MRSVLRMLAAAGVALALLAVSLPAAAHERRQVGSLIFNVGFEQEPAYLEEPNAAFITLFRSDGQPVEGADKTLKVEVGIGGAMRTFDLQPIPSRPGAYHAPFFPTRAGAYTFRFFGTVDGQPVNETFQSGPGRFDEIVSKAPLQFPSEVPSNGQLAGQGQPAQPGAGAAGTVTQADLQRALDHADSARTTGLVVGGLGLLAGLAGIVLGIVGLRARSVRTSERTDRTEPI